MIPVAESNRFNLTKESAFRIFKIVIFWVLMVNLVYYLYEDVTAYLYLAPGATLFDVLEAFAVSIDYVAWMVLIVLFEMETSALASVSRKMSVMPNAFANSVAV